VTRQLAGAAGAPSRRFVRMASITVPSSNRRVGPDAAMGAVDPTCDRESLPRGWLSGTAAWLRGRLPPPSLDEVAEAARDVLERGRTVSAHRSRADSARRCVGSLRRRWQTGSHTPGVASPGRGDRRVGLRLLNGSPQKKKTGKKHHVPLGARWGDRRIRDIKRRDIRGLLEEVAARAPIMANRTSRACAIV
jgi:hypothetical protein